MPSVSSYLNMTRIQSLRWLQLQNKQSCLVDEDSELLQSVPEIQVASTVFTSLSSSKVFIY